MATELDDQQPQPPEHDHKHFRWFVCPYAGCTSEPMEMDIRLTKDRKLICANGHPTVNMRMFFKGALRRVWSD